MNNTEKAYCRLCAEMKPQNKLIDLQKDEDMQNVIVNKLTRLDCPLDFRENLLPRTVCSTCADTLKRAYDFVVAIERAQLVLNDIILSHSIKKEVESSDSETLNYDGADEKCDSSIDIKVESMPDETDLKPISLTAVSNPVKSSHKIEVKQDLSGLDTLPLSQLKLSWEDYNWMCTYCETQFPNIAELRSHSMQFHKSCNAYRCTDCNIRKLRLDSFLIHVRRHKKYLKLSCYKCLIMFPSLSKANKHKTIHITSEFKCNGCNACFESSEELNQHTSVYYKNLRTRNIPEQPKSDGLTCLICKKKLKTRTSLNTHLLIHTDRKRDHTCEVCGKCFLHKQNLAGHMLLHDDKRPFKCEICKATFRTKNQLRKHVGVHDGGKPFSCEQCGRCFRLQKQLNSHRIIHTDSLPHVCSYCNKGFRFKTILNQHIRQHTGVKPYSCEICQRDFTNWPNYNKHMKRRHSMNMAKKKHTPDGLYPIDPATGKVVCPEMDKMMEWKKKIMERKAPGRPKVKIEVIQSQVVECNDEIKSEESND